MAEDIGLRIVSLHRALEEWRERRVLAYRHGWPALGVALIEGEIKRLSHEMDVCVRRWT